LHEKRKEMRLQKKLTHNQEPGSIQWTIVVACTITKRKEKKPEFFLCCYPQSSPQYTHFIIAKERRREEEKLNVQLLLQKQFIELKHSEIYVGFFFFFYFCNLFGKITNFFAVADVRIKKTESKAR
jgi:hypothetical protein